MNTNMVEEGLTYIESMTKDNMRMLGLSFGLVLVPNITASRNKREGRYAGFINGQHYRWGGGSNGKGIY